MKTNSWTTAGQAKVAEGRESLPMLKIFCPKSEIEYLLSTTSSCSETRHLNYLTFFSFFLSIIVLLFRGRAIILHIILASECRQTDIDAALWNSLQKICVYLCVNYGKWIHYRGNGHNCQNALPPLCITKTCLYNFDPLKPHFYIVKLGFTGVYIIFLISSQKHRLWVLVRTASPRRF